MLQWGHDKIVMEVAALERLMQQTRVLQWGHDKIVMEVAQWNIELATILNASMGP